MILTSQFLSYPKFLTISSSDSSFSRSNSPYLRLEFPKSRSNFRIYSRNGGNGLGKDPSGGNEERERNGQVTGGDGNDPKKDRWPTFNLRWSDLLNPDPDNIVAVGLTGLLTWASVQVLSQLLFISLAILLAALKYSFIAALLIFILITLL